MTGSLQTTDATGIATVGGWTLGQVAGTNALLASSNGLTGSLVSFSATGTPGPASATKSTATVPTGVAGRATTITVQASDQFGNLVRTGGATVRVSVSGANSVTPPVTDNNNGAYTASYTPMAVGTDTLAITLDEAPLSGSPYRSAVAPKIAKFGKSANTQQVPVGTTVAYAPSVKVTDGNGAPLAGVTVTFTVFQGGGTVVPSAKPTDGNGVATVDSWTVGSMAGPTSSGPQCPD